MILLYVFKLTVVLPQTERAATNQNGGLEGTRPIKIVPSVSPRMANVASIHLEHFFLTPIRYFNSKV